MHCIALQVLEFKWLLHCCPLFYWYHPLELFSEIWYSMKTSSNPNACSQKKLQWIPSRFFHHDFCTLFNLCQESGLWFDLKTMNIIFTPSSRHVPLKILWSRGCAKVFEKCGWKTAKLIPFIRPACTKFSFRLLKILKPIKQEREHSFISAKHVCHTKKINLVSL